MKRVVPLLLVTMPACSIAGMCFSPAFLSGDTEAVADLSRFEKGMTYPPSSYEIEVQINDSPLLSRIVASRTDDANQLTPRLSLAGLLSLGVNGNALPEQILTSSENSYFDLHIWSPDVCYIPELDAQRLKLTFSQAIIKRGACGYTPPEWWDNDIIAFLPNHDFSGNSDRGDCSSDNYYLNLRTGINIGAWRFRDYLTWSRGNDLAGKLEHISSAL